MTTITQSIQQLGRHSAIPDIASTINLLNEVELGTFSINTENLQLIRHNLLILSENEDHSVRDATYNTLLVLAELSPINTEDPTTLEPIAPENVFYLSTGFQFEVNSVVADYNSRKKFQNPLTREDFSLRDEQRFRELLAERNIVLSESRSYHTPPHLISWAHQHEIQQARNEEERRQRLEREIEEYDEEVREGRKDPSRYWEHPGWQREREDETERYYETLNW